MQTKETHELPSALLIPANGGHDHASLALMPFVASRDHASSTARFSYQIQVDERVRHISYTLEAGGGSQLPTQYDQPVLLSMLQLWINSDEPPTARMYFRRKPVLDLLRWPDNGQSYHRLNAALDRLMGTSFKVDTSMVSRNGKQYSRGHGAFNLIDSFWTGEGRDVLCWLQWGTLMQQAQILGDLKKLDWDLMMSLGDPVAAQLYRVLDRVTLSGNHTWTVHWDTLAQLLGMNPAAYDKPNRLKSRLQPRFDELIAVGVIDNVEYRRGGDFTFNVVNYLRGQLRAALVEAGVYDEVARQLVSGYDEVAIMLQCDCLRHGNHRAPKAVGGFLTEAIRDNYPLSYADDDLDCFLATEGLFSDLELDAYHAAAKRTLRLDPAVDIDPHDFPLQMRCIVRFFMEHGLDPELV